ncbi:TPA: hypothetical protein DCF80_00010 [Candidatus Saccharibacteria bacterium]|nr:hypothetical protein [Candidatus Saccharibacteria bacterium]HRK41028.1 DUF308 domain-containing protein [Candidatus Saccharibacteria bacterium]
MKDSAAGEFDTSMWWLGVVAGIITIFFGIAALFWPGLTLVTFVYLFSAFVLALGVVSIIKSLASIKGSSGVWWLSLIFGVLAVGLGVYLVRHPNVSFETLILLVGFTFIVRGVFDVVEGIFSERTSGSKVLFFIAGVLGVLAGVFLLTQPVAGGVAFVWILGLYALIMGPLLIAMSIDEHGEAA